jgi:predicted metal-dependent phosphoesterase TrpH
MKDLWIDLHTHSTASDGSYTPTELIRYAATKRLGALALTDHDCVDGLNEAVAEGERLGIEVIPAVELSADHSEGTMHILGFFVDRRHEGFCGRLSRLQEARKERNPKIIQRLQGLGLNITYEEVVAASGGGQVGRPHFAKVLVQKGYVSSMQEAFERYLKKGAPGFVEKFRYSPQDVIAAIHEAGGVAVLAHPFTLYKEPSPMLEPLLGVLAEYGLDGMEVIYSTYSEKQGRYYRELAEKYHLLPSGGSDFHGAHKPGIDLGVGMGKLQIPIELLEPLRKKSGGHRALNPAH